MFYVVLLILVQMYFDKPRAIELHTDAFSDNFGGKHEIVQDTIVHRGQGTAKDTNAGKSQHTRDEY